MLGIINVFILLLIIIGLIFLQIFLSKRRNKWLGLIIPFIFIIISIFASIAMPIYTVSEESSMTVTQNGKVVEEIITPSANERPSLLTIIATIIPIFLIWNIPTLIFLGIYGVCRDQMKKNGELNKMNILDLE
jgi:uncharacterized membrane protein YesL